MDEACLPSSLGGKLTHVAEECAEVIQAICKIERFGLTAIDAAGTYRDNLQDLRKELDDLEGTILRLRLHLNGA